MAKEDAMQTIDRAIKILRTFTPKETSFSLADLHQKLGLSKSSLQRILNTLVLHGLIDKDQKQKTYKLGIKLYFLGQLVDTNSSLLSVSQPFMENLRDELGESVQLNIVHQKERKCIGYLPSNHELLTITFVGQTSPLYAGASAKVLLAYFSERELTKFLNETVLNKMTDLTIGNVEELRKELNKIKELGYAVSYGERVKGAFSLSAPIKNRFGKVIAGISISIPTVRVDKEKMEFYIEHVKKTASLISEKLN